MSAAQEAYARRDWRVARDLFRAGPAAAAADLSAWADAAWWLGLVDESIEVGERAYAANVAADRPAAAAVDALTVAANYLLRGEESAGSGWLARAARALADAPDAPEHAYFRYLTEVENGPEDGRVDAARAVRAAGEHFGDPNLIALGTLGEGRAQLKAGRVADGLAALDETMVAVRSADLRPDWVGMILCGLIAAAYEMADLRRAAEWVAATERWLTTLSEAVVFQGVCRVHRSQLRAVHGDWATAEREARQVCADVADIHLATAAEAHYTLGEIHRQRGALADAEEEYQRAHRLGRDPQPGVALLLLARRHPDAALASVRAALTAEATDRLARARLCAAQVEIALAAGDPATGRKAADELAETATAYDTPGLRAAAGSARGAVLLAEGHPAEALAVLRTACRAWHELDVPYEVARTQLMLATAYGALGDTDGGRRESDAAREVLRRLGVTPGLPDGLTEREVEVLALVAAGDTNRGIGTALHIAEKTVARHLSNIFAKTGVTSRTEAAAYAFRHGLRG